MPTECIPDLFGFAPVEGRRVEVAFDAGVVTSDAGALLLGATDRAIKLTQRFADCFRDARCPELIEHAVSTLAMQRVVGIALGDEDLNDHDRLRHDPVLAVLAGKLKARRKGCAPVAGKSTLNRLELSRPVPSLYHKVSHDGAAIERLLVELFLEAHGDAPAQITLDLDATDVPLHGRQEGRFFHGNYDNYCYLPLYVFCGRHLLAAKLRRADIDAAAGSVEEVERIVRQIRGRWPKVRILLNPRFLVTSPSRRECQAQALYETLYCARGEMENRIKECQLDLFADRTSANPIAANQLRLRFAAMAYVLICALRRIGLQHTQFAKATCGTIRLRMLKIGALVTTSVRRVKFAMASSWPYQAEFGQAFRALAGAAG